MESNRFMLECTSICPETTHQKLESQRVYLTLLTVDLYVIFRVKICIHVGVASTKLQFSGKLCKIRCSFLLCNYVTYRRTFWQSLDRFHFLSRNTIFLKKHQGYSSRFCQKMGFRGREWNQTVLCWNVRLYILKLHTKN